MNRPSVGRQTQRRMYEMTEILPIQMFVKMPYDDEREVRRHSGFSKKKKRKKGKGIMVKVAPTSKKKGLEIISPPKGSTVYFDKARPKP